MVAVPTIVPLKAPGSGRKWEIDTRTAIDISSKTANTTIFYTIDGSKPDPFKKLGQSSTYKYTKPIYLGVGKITLKAMAVLNDGSRESNVNTKTFRITEATYGILEDENDKISAEEVDEDDGNDALQGTRSGNFKKENPYYNTRDYTAEDAAYNPTRKTQAWDMNDRDYRNDLRKSQTNLLERLANETVGDFSRTRSQKFLKGEDSAVRKVLNGIDLSKLQIGRISENEQVANHDMYQASLLSRGTLPPKSSVIGKHIQEENDFKRCLYCHAVRPSDPHARFCNECAAALPPLPGARPFPSDEESSKTCPSCFADVPPNSLSCIVCDKLLREKTGHLVSSYTEKVVCLQCGTSSPSGSKRCVVCESLLPVQKVFAQNIVNRPPQPNRETFLQCSKCARVNSSDARFCDWCGSRPLPSSSVVTCTTCRTNNQPYAKYCASCGQTIAPPVRPDYASLYPTQRSLFQPRSEMIYHSGEAKWLSVQAPPPKSDRKTYGTQTTGMYFASSKAIDSQCNGEDEKVRLKRPPSSVSPGKGYWRQQIDHVSQHLKIYTQNNIEFRDSVSQLRIGKLLGAIAQEELNGQELSVTLSFGLRNKEGRVPLKTSAKAVQHGVAFISALKNAKNTKDTKLDGKKKNVKRKAKKKLPSKDSKLSVETLKLIKILANTAEVELDSLKELMDAGADVNAVTSEGMTPLKLAVTSKHLECMQLLLDADADPDLKTGPKGNTVLHEAVRLGMDGADAVDKLLDASADPDIANEAGQTPYDMALKSGIDTIITKFTAKLGQDLLKETIG